MRRILTLAATAAMTAMLAVPAIAQEAKGEVREIIIKIETPEDFTAIPDDKWDAFISSISSFPDWEAMLREASKER